MDTPIQIDGLTKNFGRTRALDGLSLQVKQGEVYGFLGPNGAGKTTTIRILLDLLRPTSGRATVLGLDPHRDAVALHRRISYVPGDVALWPQLTGGQAIDVLLSLHGGADAARRRELVDRFGLDLSVKCRAYSKGNRQKVALVAALAANADLLILDEPTSGLDPLMEETFRECVREVRAQGRTVFLSSHILGEVEAVCDRVGIVRAGRLVDTGTLTELRHVSTQTVEAVIAGAVPDVSGLPGVEGVTVEPVLDGHRDGHRDGEPDGHRNSHRLGCRVTADGTAGLLRALATSDVRTLTSRPPSLEELFLRYYAAESAR
jgi:ABC-2 type transport system ATP-binding protein